MSEHEQTAEQELFPQTIEQLQALVAVQIGEVLSIPANVNALAQAILSAAAAAVAENQQLRRKQQMRLALVKTWYPGSIRATVMSSEVEGDDLLDVVLEEKNEEGNYVPTSLAEGQQGPLKQLVLSQTAQPGDVYFITTNSAVDKALEEASEMMAELAESQVH